MNDSLGRPSAPAQFEQRKPAAPSIWAPLPAKTLSGAIARHWLVILLIAAAATASAWLVASFLPQRYRASAVAAVVPVSENLTPQEIIRGVDSLERRVIVASLAAIAGLPATRQLAKAGRGYIIEAKVLPNTNLFRIEVEGPDPKHAAAIANSVPPIMARQARAMYRLYDVKLVSGAGVPMMPSSPRLDRTLATGLATGVFLGIAVAWLLDRRR